MESERRIRSIAIVHETLSRDAGDVVRFDEIVRPLVRLVEDASSSPDLAIRFVVEGDAGELPGRGRDAARGRAQRAHAERGRPRVRRTASSEGTVDVRLARDDGSADDRRARRRRRACRPGSRSSSRAGLGLSIVQALVTERARRLHRDAQRRRARRVQRHGARARCRGRAVTPGDGRSADLRGRLGALAQLPALLLGEAAPDARLLVGGEGELEALARSPGTAPQTRRAASIWSSAPPVVPMGKKSSGVVSRQAARSRHSCASQSCVRIQVSATFISPFEGRTGRRGGQCHVRPITSVPGWSELSGKLPSYSRLCRRHRAIQGV